MSEDCTKNHMYHIYNILTVRIARDYTMNFPIWKARFHPVLYSRRQEIKSWYPRL